MPPLPSSIIQYPPISIFKESHYFSLTANSIPISVPVVATYHTSTFAATSGSVTIVIKSLTGPIQHFSLQPTGSDLASASVNGNTLTFTVSTPRKLEIRINSAVTTIGDTIATPVMYLTVDLPENPAEIPSPTDKTVLYLAAGVHNLGLMQYNSTNLAPRMIYAAPGALVNAAWKFVGTTGITISGRGYFRNAFQDKSQTMMYFGGGSKNIRLQDIYLIDSPQHVLAISSGSQPSTNTSHFLIDNIKSIHRSGNSDGFSLFGPTNHVVVQNCLLINYDNQIVLQAGLPTGPYNNTFQNNIFIKPSSAGNFLYLNPNRIPSATIGPFNRFLSFNLLRLSGQDGLISSPFPKHKEGYCETKVEELIFEEINVVSWESRKGCTNKNFFLHLESASSSSSTTAPTNSNKKIKFKSCPFPPFPLLGQGWNGTLVEKDWKIVFEDCTIGGIKLKKDEEIGLIQSGGGRVEYC